MSWWRLGMAWHLRPCGPMRRFLVIVDWDYYPGGGTNDWVGDFDTIEEARAAAAAAHGDNRLIVDMQTGAEAE